MKKIISLILSFVLLISVPTTANAMSYDIDEYIEKLQNSKKQQEIDYNKTILMQKLFNIIMKERSNKGKDFTIEDKTTGTLYSNSLTLNTQSSSKRKDGKIGEAGIYATSCFNVNNDTVFMMDQDIYFRAIKNNYVTTIGKDLLSISDFMGDEYTLDILQRSHYAKGVNAEYTTRYTKCFDDEKGNIYLAGYTDYNNNNSLTSFLYQISPEKKNLYCEAVFGYPSAINCPSSFYVDDRYMYAMISYSNTNTNFKIKKIDLNGFYPEETMFEFSRDLAPDGEHYDTLGDNSTIHKYNGYYYVMIYGDIYTKTYKFDNKFNLVDYYPIIPIFESAEVKGDKVYMIDKSGNLYTTQDGKNIDLIAYKNQILKGYSFNEVSDINIEGKDLYVMLVNTKFVSRGNPRAADNIKIVKVNNIIK